MVYKYDFLIIGSGVAGMSYALKVARAHKGKVCMICKTSLDEANTSFAQGGVASVTNLEVDNFDKHIQDTTVHITQKERDAWNGASAAINGVNIISALSNKADKEDVPTKVS